MNDLLESKKKLRAESLRKRNLLFAASSEQASEQASKNFFNHFMPLITSNQNNSNFAVSAYYPMRDEISPLSITQKLFAMNINVCLPETGLKATPLVFKLWCNDETLEFGLFGTLQSKNQTIIEPTILIVPLLAFDKKGFRLGFGGGYYDATLANFRKNNKKIIAVGLAFSGQEVNSVPIDDKDEKLDVIITEKETIII